MLLSNSVVKDRSSTVARRSTTSLNHMQEHYMSLLLKNNSIELQFCTVHKTSWTNVIQQFTLIGMACQATPLHCFPSKHDFLDETLQVLFICDLSSSPVWPLTSVIYKLQATYLHGFLGWYIQRCWTAAILVNLLWLISIPMTRSLFRNNALTLVHVNSIQRSKFIVALLHALHALLTYTQVSVLV